MKWILCVTGVLLLAAAPHDPHPLNDNQLTRLETVDDGSLTVDEAAFYALLENVADWSDKQAGAVVPDYDAIRRDPEAWRGQRCLVEGTIYRVIDLELMRRGWEKVQGVVIRVDESRKEPIAEDFVIVYLTDPPAWTWWVKEKGVPQEHGAKVRVVARMYKLLSDRTQGGEKQASEIKTYLTFVGRSLGPIEAAARGPGAVPGKLVFFFAIVVVAIGFLFWRIRALGRGSARQVRLQDYIEQRRERRPLDEEPAVEETEDLPNNPSDALGTLAERHEHRSE